MALTKADKETLAEVVVELDIITSWLSGARAQKVNALAAKVTDLAGQQAVDNASGGE